MQQKISLLIFIQLHHRIQIYSFRNMDSFKIYIFLLEVGTFQIATW